jgi:hypothetical protein
MSKVYHILNGDALKEQLPPIITGERIVARECLVDGDVSGVNLLTLFQSRARFISENYQGYTIEDYYDRSVTEFQKIQHLPEDSEVNLWFEDDLFCQVNFWFVTHLIYGNYKNQRVFLIRPKANCDYNFGAMTHEELVGAFRSKMNIAFYDLKELSKLWKLYQQDDCDEMIEVAEGLYSRFPFLLKAIKAHGDRLPKDGTPGRPTQSLFRIMEELNTSDFAIIFKEFKKREGIYGFGDLQVRRILDEIRNKEGLL